jgi:predicted CXXCH cytochrome family protein
MRWVARLFFVSVAVLGGALPAGAKECLDCHELAEISPGGTVVHPPFEKRDCGSCHADHGDEKRLMLTKEGNALCEKCHAFTDGAFLAAHRKIAPTGKASCTGCHDPHRAPGRRLLRAELHAPVKAGTCEKCHRSGGKLLIPINRDFCFICHQRATFARPVVHDPVQKARCLDCHDPHGSRYVRLLKGNYTLDLEVRRGGREYGFCLSCHERGRLFDRTGEGGTRFADGERNLHALHVLARGRSGERTGGERATDEKGRTCRTCHEAHSANTAALTRTELDCGASLCMKMEFRRSDEGGECMASCHSTRTRYRPPAAAPAVPAQLQVAPQP